MRILFLYDNCESVPLVVAPVGMLTAAAAASGAGHEVSALDLSFSPRPAAELEGRLASFKPEAIGISIRVLNQFISGDTQRRINRVDTAKGLVKLIREHSAAPIILGGPGFSHAPAEVFEFLKPDYGIEGEGERSLPALLHALAARTGAEHVPGVLWRGEDGRLRRNPPELIDDLDSIPVQDPGLIDYRGYLRRGAYVSVNTSRGCNRRCVYCDDPAKGRYRIRVRSPEKVVDEIAWIQGRYGYRYYYIADSNFTGFPGHARAFCEELLRRNVRIRWEVDPNPGDLSEDLIALMKEAGCEGVTLGVDTGSEQMLRNYKKGFSQRRIAEIARWLRKHELPFMFTVIVGGPGETDATFRESVRFFEQVDPPDMIFFGLGMDVCRGSELLDIARAEGMLPDRPDFMRGVHYTSPALGEGFAREISRVCAAHPGWVSEGFVASRARAAAQRVMAFLGVRPAWKGFSRIDAAVSKLPAGRLLKG